MVMTKGSMISLSGLDSWLCLCLLCNLGKSLTSLCLGFLIHKW